MLNDKDKDSSGVKSDDDERFSYIEDEIMVPDFDNYDSIISKSSPALENLTCPECNVTFEKSWKLKRHQTNPWLDRSGRQNKRPNFTDKDTKRQSFKESDSPSGSRIVDNTTANNEDVKKSESDISDYDFVPIDDLPFPVVEELIQASEGDKVDDCAVNLDSGNEPINNLVGNLIVDTPELAVEEVEEGVDIEEFVHCKTEEESEELVTIHDSARRETSRGLQIAKVKNEDGEEVKLFTNLDGVYDIVPDFDSHACTVQSIEPTTLEDLTCPECKVIFDKSWKLNRHLRNPWLNRSPQQNKKRRLFNSRKASNDDKEADLQNDAKRPRLSRIRAEKLIKNMTKRDNPINDDNDNRDDSDFHASSDSGDKAESSSDDESVYGEDNLSHSDLDFDDSEIFTESGRYKCLKCNTTYATKYDLRRHLTTTLVHTGRTPHRYFAKTGIPTQDEIALLKCSICATNFDSEATLTKHKSTHDKKCEICDLEFLHESKLVRHLKCQKHAVALRCRRLSEAGVVTFSCDKCDQVEFPDLLGIFNHMKEFHQSCQELTTHDAEVSTESGKYKCLKRKTTYGSKRQFRRHLPHKGRTPRIRTLSPTQNEIATLKCTICAGRFDDVETLTEHKSTHDKTCDSCDLTFPGKYKLRLHLKSQKHVIALRCRKLNEDGVATFSCDKCDQVGFPDFCELLQHRKKMHVETLDNILTESCDTTEEKIDNLSTLANNKARRKIKCKECEKNLCLSSKHDAYRHRQSRRHQLAVLAKRVDSDGKVSFVCDPCPEVEPFSNYSKLAAHRKRYHPGRNTDIDGITAVKSCLPCNRDFYSLKGYDKHILSQWHGDKIGATKELDFACNLCDKKFAANFQLKAHLVYAHTTAFICEMCGMRCRNLSRFTTHQKTHVQPPTIRHRYRYIPPADRPFPCKFCDKRFTRIEHLNKHVNTIHLGKRYKCDVCRDILACADSLRTHKKHVHGLKNGEPQATKLARKKSQHFKCDICLKGVAKALGIQHVELVHFQDKRKCPYDCCPDLEFETEPEWIQHLEGCTSDKITEASQCSCILCGAVFRNQLLRLSHHHRTHQTLPCEICSKSFSMKSALTLHKNSHEESKPHLCAKCGKRFRQAVNLRFHLTTVCGDDEEARKALIEKRRALHKSFRDKKKNFNCDECSKGFITLEWLESHKKKVHAGDDNDGGNRTSGTEDSETD